MSLDVSMRRGALGAIGSAAVVKVLVMGISGVLGIVTSRLIISSFGTEAYAQYGLLSTITTLLPFVDLGLAAVLINSVAGSAEPARDPVIRQTLTTVVRVLLCSSAIILAVGVVITAAGAWPALLGHGLQSGSGSLSALLCVIVFCTALPMTIGSRVLVGLGRNTQQLAVSAVVAPFILLVVGTLVLLHLPLGGYLAVVSYAASAVNSLICLALAARLLKPQVGRAIRDVPRLRSAPSIKVMHTAWPMLVQMLALPIAMQTDRLLISHLTRGDQLAQYNLASQLFGIILQTTAAAGIALWPVYARARARAEVQTPDRATAAFAAGAFALATALAVVSPWLVDLVSGGRLHLDAWLVWGFVAFATVQAAKYPVGMYMTDQRGLRFQVVPILILVPINLGMSWWLIGVIGAGGTIVGSTISVVLCQVIPNLLFVRADLSRRRAELAARPRESSVV